MANSLQFGQDFARSLWRVWVETPAMVGTAFVGILLILAIALSGGLSGGGVAALAVALEWHVYAMGYTLGVMVGVWRERNKGLPGLAAVGLVALLLTVLWMVG